MIRSRLRSLERKVKTLGLARENFPEAIMIRVVGCFNPQPERITLSDTEAVPIYHLCKPGGGDCETCRFYDPERVRRERESLREAT